MSQSTHPARRRVRVLASAALTLAAVGATVLPAEAAVKSVFSSSGNLGVYACRYSSTSIKLGVQNYTSSPIYRVYVVDSGGRGTYVDYVPGHYGSKTGQYVQVIADGTKYVKVQWSSSSSKRSLGSFTLTKSALPAC